MDIATIAGIIAGFVFIVMGIITSGGNMMAFVDIPSVLVTIGGTIAALFVAYPIGKVTKFFIYVVRCFRVYGTDPGGMINMLVTFSEKARREGLLALEDDVEEINDDFLKKGVQLVVDGTDPELVKSILNTDLNRVEERHQVGIDMMDQASTLAPAFGMIGTLLGLINMLGTLEDKSSISKGMSVALVTTLYGAVLANLLFTPWKRKLEMQHADEMLIKEIMLEGTLSIQSGDNPRIVKDKLASFLSPSVRDRLSEGEREGA